MAAVVIITVPVRKAIPMSCFQRLPLKARQKPQIKVSYTHIKTKLCAPCIWVKNKTC